MSSLSWDGPLSGGGRLRRVRGEPNLLEALLGNRFSGGGHRRLLPLGLAPVGVRGGFGGVVVVVRWSKLKSGVGGNLEILGIRVMDITKNIPSMSIRTV